MEQTMSYQDENNDDQSDQQGSGGFGALLLLLLGQVGGGHAQADGADRHSPGGKSGFVRASSPKPPSSPAPVASIKQGWRDYPDLAAPHTMPVAGGGWSGTADESSALRAMGLTEFSPKNDGYAEILRREDRHLAPARSASINEGEGVAIPEMRRQLAHMGGVFDNAIEMEARRAGLERTGAASSPAGALWGGGDRAASRVRAHTAAGQIQRRPSMSSLPILPDQYGGVIRVGIVKRGREIFDLPDVVCFM